MPRLRHVASGLVRRTDSAEIEGAEVQADLATPLRWTFDGEAAGWASLPSHVGEPAVVTAEGGALRVRLAKESVAPDDPKAAHGGIYAEISDFAEDFTLDSWRQVVVEARVTGPMDWVGIGYNVQKTPGNDPDELWPTEFFGAGTGLKADGKVHTYRFGMTGQGGPVSEPVRQMTIEFGGQGPADIELLSITVEPAGDIFADSGFGVRSVSSSAHEDFGPQRRTIYAHVPARISYPLRVPTAGRLDLALGSFAGTAQMSVRVDFGDSTEVVLQETVPPKEGWRQRSVDLSRWSGRDVTLSLVAAMPDGASGGSDGSVDPSVAFWASPTLTSASPEAVASRPNVIFYVIDGASANLMSVYGYERPTTPNLERIAAEGVVFESAHSNATWTMPSTASFMTSLHHSVLGGLKNGANPVPPNVKTMAEHFHDAGFHTGVFTFNPNAGALSGLDRAVDVFRDFGKRAVCYSVRADAA